ncbi:hypothetical protein BV25DRAFT_1830140 [Artomyces pyxidatus]|uniref:Uncharacterized protein n=1 Tax=Artomyces pyxidatus TaxID=48021 RepID=A0ACB8SQF9_9AGAM|nr:hypothetical protein BV25DRAFT_1830140 [Artomyces pyxidatus]
MRFHHLIPGLTKITRLTASLANSLGVSRTFNRRNLEHYWYPLWCRLLIDLVADCPNLIVCPQFPVWVILREDDDDGLDDDASEGDHDEDVAPTAAELEEDAAQEQRRVARALKKARNRAKQADREHREKRATRGAASASPSAPSKKFSVSKRAPRVSGASSGATVPGKDATGVVVDFAIVHVTAETIKAKSKAEKRYGGWRITTENVPLLVEIKRRPKRHLSGAALKNAIGDKIEEGIDDIIIQAAYVFATRPHILKIRAIVAAGPFWTSAILVRNKHFDRQAIIPEQDRNFVASEEGAVAPHWTIPLELYTKASDKRLQAIRKHMKDLGPHSEDVEDVAGEDEEDVEDEDIEIGEVEEGHRTDDDMPPEWEGEEEGATEEDGMDVDDWDA